MSPIRPKLPRRRTRLGPVKLYLDDLEWIVERLREAGQEPVLESLTAEYDSLEELVENEATHLHEVSIGRRTMDRVVRVTPHDESQSMAHLDDTGMRAFLLLEMYLKDK